MFTKEMLPNTVSVTLTSRLFKDDEGKPVTFSFEFKFETGEISDRHERFSLEKKRPAEELNLNRFALLLDKPPKGCDDFPADGSLYQNAMEYFNDSRFTHIVTEALIAYNQAMRPEGLSR